MKQRAAFSWFGHLAAVWVLFGLLVRVLTIPLILARALWNTLDAALRGDLRHRPSVPRPK